MVGLGNLLKVLIEDAVSECTKPCPGLGLFCEGVEGGRLTELVA